MAIHPSSDFPVLPGDQADVIRIYLELMRDRYPSRPVSESTVALPLGPPDSSERTWFTGQVPDLD
jgi:hypothetical protein